MSALGVNLLLLYFCVAFEHQESIRFDLFFFLVYFCSVDFIVYADIQWGICHGVVK